MNSYIKQQKTQVQQLENSLASKEQKTTIVQMQQDYANDEQRCLTSVAFIEGQIVSQIIQKVIEPLKAIEPEHFYAIAESMHLTIKNIQTISSPPTFTESDVIKVHELYKKIVPKFSSFEFSVEDVILFPTSISVMAYCSEALKELVLEMDRGLKEIGVPDNKTYFSNEIFWGNVTVCRFVCAPSKGFIDAVKRLRTTEFGTFRVETISLVTCNAVCHPTSRRIIGEYNLI